jgi:hypothetical protein
VRHRLHDDPPEPRCDPEEIGNICTIAGNGENGYDRDADDRGSARARGQVLAARRTP